MNKHILNIEGIPGSGKSCAAARLDKLFRANEIDSYWVHEQDPNHPIGTSRVRRTDSAAKIAAYYLDLWQEFVRSNNKVAILDGYALQSSVRFLFAMKAQQSVLNQYFKQWQKIGRFSSSIVFLHVEDTVEHFQNFVFPLRGEDWCQKVSGYVSATPYGKERGLVGNEGLIEFWSEYQAVCLELLRDSFVATRIQNYTDRNWIEGHLDLMKHTDRV